MSLAGLGLLVALGACTTGPDYQRPDVALPAAHRAPVTVVTAAEAQALVDGPWWQQFKDPALNQLIQTALVANLDLVVASERVAEFDAKLQVSRAAELPQVSYAGSAKRQRLSEQRPVPLPIGTEPTNNAFEGSLNIGWELDLWGRVRRANEAARAELLATEEARRAVMLSVASSVASTYVELLGLDRQLQLVLAERDNRQQSLELVRKRYEGGSATLLAVAEAQAQVNELATSVPDIQRQITTLENALSVLLGQAPGPVARGALDKLVLPEVPPGVPSDLLQRRPDVQAAEQKLVAANARIGIAKAQYFPTISLTGALGHSSDALDQLLKRSATFGEIGGGLLGVLFDGGRIEGDIQASQAVQRQMVASYRQAALTALQEVEDALVTRQRVGERLDLIGQQLANSRELARLTQLRKDGGQSTQIDVLQADQYVNNALRAQAMGQHDQMLSLVAIYKAMGGGWMQEQERLQARRDEGATPAGGTNTEVKE